MERTPSNRKWAFKYAMKWINFYGIASLAILFLLDQAEYVDAVLWSIVIGNISALLTYIGGDTLRQSGSVVGMFASKHSSFKPEVKPIVGQTEPEEFSGEKNSLI